MVGLSILLFSCLVVLAAGKCPSSFECGYLTYRNNITFPFTSTQHPDCGILFIHGCDDHESESPKTIQNNNRWYNIIDINGLTITIRDDELHDILLRTSCDVLSYKSIFTISTPLASSKLKHFVSVFGCNNNSTLENLQQQHFYSVTNSSAICRNDTIIDIYGTGNKTEAVVVVVDPTLVNSEYLKGCSMVQLPTSDEINYSVDEINHSVDAHDLFTFVTADIPIQIQVSPPCSTCQGIYGGQCRLDNTGKFYCHQGRSLKPLILVAAASATGLLGVMISLAWCLRRRFFSSKNPAHKVIEIFLKNHGHLAAKRYSYSEIKKATNSFKNKLGKGGYGSVYKGKLQDGSHVAVKILTESKGNGEEFINEVASISVTSHVNIVSLLGFCLEGSKRALIYDYMPNGSLEKLIDEDRDPSMLNIQLSCKTMYNIAIGVGRGLEYLHKGCNTKILHFDIKPHNILLDEDFCPKISDFGLAKVCPRKDSIISLLGTRGTIGYIAPELFSRNFGNVSHKSDVYSYGMMVLEMVGAKRNISVDEVECSSEIYFPHWVYKRLELNQEPGLRIIRNEIDKEMVRKMVIVSLWCIQTDPSNRPSMSRVVEMMEGKLESLQIPPKPFFSEPLRSPSRLSDYSTETSPMINEITSEHSSWVEVAQ